MVSTKHHYSWVPDVPDKRDLMYGAVHDFKVDLPSSINLKQYCSKVEDQAELGSCTANACVSNLEYLENVNNTANFQDFSRLFVYYCTRKLQNTVRYDSGASLRTTIKALVKYGACSEDKYPYDITKYKKKPPAECFLDADPHKVTAYMRINTLPEMRQCLASGYPFVFGMAVYSSFESEEVERTGIVNLPDRYEDYCGGHACCAVGFDDRTRRFLVRNSWSEFWGMGGYFTIPYNYLADRDLADDFWTIRTISGI